MPAIYLGFFETLGEILAEVFESVLFPVLEVLATTLFEMAAGMLEEIFATLMLTVLAVLLTMVSRIEYVFDLFAGTKYVLYYPEGVASTQLYPLEEKMTVVKNGVTTVLDQGSLVNYKQTYLIDLFTTQGPVARIYWAVMLVGVVLVVLFTIFAVTRSMGSMILDGKHPLGRVMTQAGKACLTFLLIPFMTLALCRISTVVVVGVQDALGDGDISLANVLFCVASMGDTDTGKPSPGFQDSVRSRYYYGSKSFTNTDQIKRDFNIKKFDFLTTYIVVIALIVIMAFTIFISIKRLFEAAVLFLLSPLFVSVMPVDDGNMFQKWLNAYVGRIFSAMGSVFAMKLLLSFVGVLCSGRIKMADSAAADSILRMAIILGGAFAAFKSQQTFLEILSPETAQSNRLLANAVVGGAAGAAMNSGRSLVRGVRSGSAQSKAARISSRGSGSESEQTRDGGGGEVEAGRGGKSGGDAAESSHFSGGSPGGIGKSGELRGVSQKEAP